MNQFELFTTDIFIEESGDNDDATHAIPPVIATIMMVVPLMAFAFVQISGLAPIRKILKDKSTGDMSPLPFVAFYTNCGPWTLYSILGLRTDSSFITVLIANVTGTLSGIIFTAIFAKYAKQSLLKYYIGSGVILGVTLSTPFWTPFLGIDAMTVLGTYGCASAVVLMSSPLAVIRTVIQQKSTEAMSLLMSFAMFFNSLVWAAYGWFIVFDFYVLLPNGFSLVTCIIQLFLFIIYPSKKHNDFVLETPNDMKKIPSYDSDSDGVAV